MFLHYGDAFNSAGTSTSLEDRTQLSYRADIAKLLGDIDEFPEFGIECFAASSALNSDAWIK